MRLGPLAPLVEEHGKTTGLLGQGDAVRHALYLFFTGQRVEDYARQRETRFREILASCAAAEEAVHRARALSSAARKSADAARMRGASSDVVNRLESEALRRMALHEQALAEWSDALRARDDYLYSLPSASHDLAPGAGE